MSGLCIISPAVGKSGNRQGCWGGGSAGRNQFEMLEELEEEDGVSSLRTVEKLKEGRVKT